ncbi:MAG: DEAD/DEAH box helicase family protein [Deltaproteobacteria bacterium]|nr:DEAD/DEAH box helicase family protein [Deltaproteobacteria bacterium]
MSAHSLKEYPFEISYGPSDDRLHGFYIPALSRSIRYHRSAGFFSSTALAVAASGVAHLIKNEGSMRLLVGANLDENDVAAIQKGHDLSRILRDKLLPYLDNPDEFAKKRLEVLAWMVAKGTLEIKVVLPQRDGIPLSAGESRDYYHPKEGLFTDKEGNQLAFSGSVNESAQSWEKNYEQFMVYRSWDESAPYLKQVAYRFNRLWDGREPDWIAIPIPDAVKENLIKFKPKKAPTRDPLERIEVTQAWETVDLKERIIFQFLRDAPFLPNGKYLASETATVRLWPHQQVTVEDIISRFPTRCLLCSEVGLGKTIEAGMALRQLVLSGKVKRCLILTPKSIARQWQEELYEKMGLNVPVYTGKVFKDYFGNEIQHNEGNPWAAHPIFIASSQLAKRRERQEEVLSAGPWDLVIIDEAHHARRKDFLDERRRPNRLLELLEGTGKLPGLTQRTRGLILLTATPMQVHPVEVWDLLKNLDLGGRWEASEEHFLRFFEELRKPFENVDWEFVLNMFEDSLATGTELDELFAQMAQERLGPVEWEQIKSLSQSSKKQIILKQISSQGRVFLTDMVKRHTPIKRLLKRSTRKLLRHYKEKGLLEDTVPTRRAKPEWIPMAEDENALYERIEEYFSDFYQKYESERKGLGFVMTVYRRRLTSSFYAVEKSLERRLFFLKGQAIPEAPQGLTEEDTEQEELSLDIGEAIEGGEKLFSGEIEYVEDFLRDIRKLTGDSKWEKLHADVKEFLKTHDSIVIFTHYTDTMDYLRDQLRQVYGSQVACYSGRGGEIWNGHEWVIRTKEEIKNAFQEAKDIKILVCTDAASEGLNLQTCGVLINYDMPWNPMRAEQRIGRIDRIGGHEVVHVRNYFYEDTVEAKVYQALSRRIDMFEWVVGELQPILSSVERTIQELALMRKEQRKTRIEEAIQHLNKEYDDQIAKGLKLDDYLSREIRKAPGDSPPLTLVDLEKALTLSSSLKPYWEKDIQFPNTWRLKWEGRELSFTFDRDLFDTYPETLRLMTYGEPLLERLLELAQPLTRPTEPGVPVVRFSVRQPEPLVAYYALGKSEAVPIKTIRELESVLDTEPPDGSPGEKAESHAKEQFEDLVRKSEKEIYEKRQTEYQSRLLTLEEQGRRLLVKTALCDIAISLEPTLFDQIPTEADFDEETVQRLKSKGFPFAPLFHLIDTGRLKPEPTDPFWLKIQGKSEREIRGTQDHLKREARKLVETLSQLKSISPKRPETGPIEIRRFYGDTTKERPGLTLVGAPPKEERFKRFLSVYSLKAAAGYFGNGEPVEPEGWVEVNGFGTLDERMFVARAVGRSMEPKIHDGDYLLFRQKPVGSRVGKIVLVQYRGPEDPETGGAYTVKKYNSKKVPDETGGWRHNRIVLSPLNPEFSDIIIEEDKEGAVDVIAEYIGKIAG